MFGKLLKYEFKHSARYIMAIYACAAAVAAFMFIGMLTKITWISVVGSIVLYIVGIVTAIMTLVAVIKNFYDTLYGKQGYLSFTLPVKCSTMLVSKVIISFFWIILSVVTMLLIVLLVALSARSRVEGSLGSISEVIEASGIIDMLPSGTVVVKLIAFLTVSGLLSILTFVGFVYFSVTLANTRALQKHPLVFGILIFFGTYGIANSIQAKLTYSLPLTFQVSNDKAMFAFEAMDKMNESIFTYGVGGTIFMAAVAVGLLFATGWIMNHKVNIK